MSYKEPRLESDSINQTSWSCSSPGSQLNSSSGPYRGRYTRSSLGVSGGGSGSGSSGNSRFSPYSISRDQSSSRRSIPLIRAKRDGDNLNLSNFGSTSSTAQEIMDALASMSTPVLCAGRVRMDSLEAVKPGPGPIGSSFLNSSGTMSSKPFGVGPPKTSSPLLLPRSTTGMRQSADNSNWSLRCLSGPRKMVDSGTNTDECGMFNDLNNSPSTANSPTKATTSPPKPVIKTQIVTEDQQKPFTVTQKSISDSKINESKSVPLSNGKYSFNKAWTLEDFDKYLTSNQCKTAMKTDSSSSSSTEVKNSLVNGDDRRLDHTNFKTVSGMVNSKVGKASVEKKWECPTCMVPNASNDTECVCCTTRNPDAKSHDEPDTAKKGSSVAVNSNFKWNCPTCIVPNDATASACVCCAEPNPTSVDNNRSTPALSSRTPPKSEFKSGVSGFNFGVSSEPKLTTGNTGFVFGFKTTPVTSTTASVTPSESTNTTSTGLRRSSTKPSIAAGYYKLNTNASEDNEESKIIELWQCDICDARNKFQLHSCVGCGSPRPYEFDPNYKKPEEKPKKDLKFEPIFRSAKSTAQSFFSTTPSILSSVSPASTVGLGTGTTFATSSFSSGKPFGASGAFNSGNSFDSGSGSSLEKSSASLGTFGKEVVTSTPTIFNIGGTATTTTTSSVSSPIASVTSQGFVFGSSSSTAAISPSKRKHEEGVDGDYPANKIAPTQATTVMFGTSTATPTLKLEDPVSIIPQQTISQPAAPVNNAGFLEALKNASAAVKASSEKQPNPFTPEPPLNKGFQLGSGGTTSGQGFGTTSGQGFGTTSAPTGVAQPFNFGSSSGTGQSGFNPTSSMPVASPPPQFSLTPNLSFGAAAASNTGFKFGANPNPSSGGGALTVPSTFSFATANTNNAPAPLFQFQATSTPGSVADGGRKIRKATRRYQR